MVNFVRLERYCKQEQSVFSGCKQKYLSFQAVEELMKYLDSNLLTLNQYLLKANFDRILQSIWVEVLEEFNEVLVTEESVREDNHDIIFREMRKFS